jgi:hypothetical protein
VVNPVVLRLVEEEYLPSSLNVILLDWYSIYWLYWYKSTSTDAEGAALASSLNVILLDWYSIYWLYWHKSTNTDAEGAAGITRRKRPLASPPSTSSRVLVYEAFSC